MQSLLELFGIGNVSMPVGLALHEGDSFAFGGMGNDDRGPVMNFGGQQQPVSTSAQYKWLSSDCGDVKPIDLKNAFK